MNTLKSELKLQFTHEIGVKVEDTLEAAKREISTAEGKQIAFMEAIRTVETVSSVVNKDVEAGQLDLETAKKAIQYLTRATQALQQQASQSVVQRNMAAGKAQGIEQVVKMLVSITTIEQNRLNQAKAQAPVAQSDVPASNDSTASVPVHRFVSIKEQRLAEEAAAAAQQVKQESPQAEAESASEDHTAPVALVASEDAPKRRGRKPRASNA